MPERPPIALHGKRNQTRVGETLLRVQDLKVHFPQYGGGLWHREQPPLRAVDGVSFDLSAGEALGIVGESGCGKSTLARAVLGLIRPTGGRVLWLGENLHELDDQARRARRQSLQVVFQDPLASLNPRLTVGESIAEPLRSFHPNMTRVQVEERVRGMLKLVGLLPNQINRYPHEFSGGQCQRIGIARALILNPKLVVCDEPVSALDVSVQAQIVQLLQSLQRKLDLALIFIAHDLSVVRELCDRVMVMYLGRAMELAPRETLYRRPLHPYSQALIHAVPIPDPGKARRAAPPDHVEEVVSPTQAPQGCVFRNRCPHAVNRCAVEVPSLRRIQDDNWAACHRAEELDLTLRTPE